MAIKVYFSKGLSTNTIKVETDSIILFPVNYVSFSLLKVPLLNIYGIH